jgi:hypothetical protein
MSETRLSLVAQVLSEEYRAPFEITGELKPGNYGHNAIDKLVEAHRLWMTVQRYTVGGFFSVGTFSTAWKEGETIVNGEPKDAFVMRGYIPATPEEAHNDEDRNRLASLAGCLGTAVGDNRVYLYYVGRLVVIKV